MKIGIAFKHHSAVRVVLGQHIGTGAHRVPVECQVLLGHSRLAKEAIDLARYRGKKRHRQPVEKLRILATQLDAQGMAVDARHTLERKAVKVKPGSGGQTLGLLV